MELISEATSIRVGEDEDEDEVSEEEEEEEAEAEGSPLPSHTRALCPGERYRAKCASSLSARSGAMRSRK